MKIDRIKIKNYIKQLEIQLEEYEINYVNLYNELSCLSNVWNDGIYEKLETVLKNEKPKIVKNYNDLESLKNIYQTLLDKYENIGNKIIVTLDNKNSLILKINSYIDLFNTTIKSFDDINYHFCNEIGINIYKYKNTIIQNKNNVINIKNNIVSLIEYIEQTEKEINNMISRIDLEVIDPLNLEYLW